MNNPSVEPQWQCVLVCWGEKYGVHVINNLVKHILTAATSEPAFVLVTDRPKPGLLACVQTVEFPPFWRQPSFFRGGCQAKLAIFESEVLPYQVATVYVDLDTMVFGDISQGFSFVQRASDIAIFQSGLLPLGRIGQFIFFVTKQRRYARANSSLIFFHPSETQFIAEKFREEFRLDEALTQRFMIADDRFISWVAQKHLCRIPPYFAVKFPDEFMSHFSLWLYVRASFPWVKYRREKLIAITLNGLTVKPEQLLKLADGERMEDRRGRVLIWSQKTVGFLIEKIEHFYQTNTSKNVS